MGDVVIKTDDLQYIDLTRFGSFSQVENLNSFLATPLGEAQEKYLVEAMKEQALAQGHEDYEPKESSVRRVIFHAQVQQNYSQDTNIITDKEMLDKYAPSWYEKLLGLKDKWVDAASESLDDALEPYGPASRDTSDEPYVGQGGANRAKAIDSMVNSL